MVERRRELGRGGTRPRVLGLGLLVAAALALAVVVVGGGESYRVKARFLNAGQLVSGNPVQTGGVPIGTVTGIEITDDGQAEIELDINDDFAPLREGTRARIRQFSQSGIANRYVDLTMPPHGGNAIADGGVIDVDKTRTAVDLDQLFNTLDRRTRRSLQGFFKNQARQFEGMGEKASEGVLYLNPALSTSSRLFRELSHDTPVLERFLVDSSRLVGAVAERRDHLAGLIGHLNQTTGALARERVDLAAAVAALPPFMRRANTTFVNLRAALGDVDPLVEASKPAAARLGPVLQQARGFAAEAQPTVRDLSQTIRRPGPGNDLIELLRAVPPLADIALVTKTRAAAPGGREVSVGRVRGAFPETSDAFEAAAPVIGFARPYTSDFLGWFDDFSTTGAGFDALGNTARGQVAFVESLPDAVSFGNFHRCPGSSEPPAPDGSNLLSEEEREALHCNEDHRAVKK